MHTTQAPAHKDTFGDGRRPPGAARERSGSWWFAPLRWLARAASGAVRWMARLLRAPVRPFAHGAGWAWTLARGALRLLAGALFRRRPPDSKRGFGFWWLVVTLVIAGAVGLIVAALLTPVAGLVALLAVGVWALIRHARSSRTDERKRSGARTELPAAAATG